MLWTFHNIYFIAFIVTKESDQLLTEIGCEDQCREDNEYGNIHCPNNLLPLHGKCLVILLVLLRFRPLDKERKERRTEHIGTRIPVIIPCHHHIREHGKDKGKDDFVLPCFEVGKEVDGKNEKSECDTFLIRIERSSKHTETHY